MESEQLNERDDIENRLDKADAEAEQNDVRYVREDVFRRVRERIIKHK